MWQEILEDRLYPLAEEIIIWNGLGQDAST